MAKDAKWYAGWVRLANAQSADEKLTNLETADFIENLAAELEAVKRERDAAVERYKHVKENANILSDAVTQLERERDAAVKDVKSLCATNYFSGDYCEYCKYKEEDGQCRHDCLPYTPKWGWEWRGPCAENGGAE